MPPKKKIKEDPDVIVLTSSSDEETDENTRPATSGLNLNTSSNLTTKRELNTIRSSATSNIASRVLYNSINAQVDNRQSTF